MPRGRPKNLSAYEQLKAKKIRSALADNQIHKFDRINDSSLLTTVQVSSSGKIFVSYSFHEKCMQDISKLVEDYIGK
jgi:hypothetical protein